MKKFLAIVLALSLCLALVACSSSGSDKKGEGVMTYAQYAAAALDTQVVVETYVQAKQSWWNDQATLYT